MKKTKDILAQGYERLNNEVRAGASTGGLSDQHVQDLEQRYTAALEMLGEKSSE